MNEQPIEPEVEGAVTAVAVRETQGAVDKALSPEQTQKPQVTAAQAKVEAVANLTMAAYQRASLLQLSESETKALQEDFPDDAFRPGAAGKESLIYIEHANLRDRLNKVLGLGQWSIIPRSRWNENYRTARGIPAVRVYVEAMLVIRGAFVAEAVGDMSYFPNNDAQNYGDAVEGAKTQALRRCAKELGIGLQAWRKEWCDGWWARKNAKDKAPAKPAPEKAPAPAAKPAPIKPPPSKLGMAIAAQKPAETPEQKKARFLTQCVEAAGGDEGLVYGLFVEMGILLDTEGLEDFPIHRLPTTQGEANNIFEEICTRVHVAKGETIPEPDKGELVEEIVEPENEVPVEPEEPAQEAPAEEWNPEWKEMTVPFGKDAGAKFSDLDAKGLWWWIAVWAAKPLEPFYSKKTGKSYPPKPDDVRLWNMFNENRAAAMKHYNFKEPED